MTIALMLAAKGWSCRYGKRKCDCMTAEMRAQYMCDLRMYALQIYACIWLCIHIAWINENGKSERFANKPHSEWQAVSECIDFPAQAATHFISISVTLKWRTPIQLTAQSVYCSWVTTRVIHKVHKSTNCITRGSKESLFNEIPKRY